MAITPEQAEAQEAGHAHQRAQAAALQWAEVADTEHRQALEQDDYARHPDRTGNPHLRDALAAARQQALAHGVRSADARRLAEMWAAVAGALATRPLTRGTTTVHVGFADPKATDTAIRDQLRGLQQRGNGTF